jgi:AMP phosphorylase
MKWKVKPIGIDAQEPFIFLRHKDAEELAVHTGDKILIKSKNIKVVAELSLAEHLLPKGHISLPINLFNFLKKPKEVSISPLPQPKSLNLILKKMKGKVLTKKEIHSIIQDISNNSLSEAEIAYFVSAVYQNGMSMNETIYLTDAMFLTGKSLKWASKDIADKHCIGGIAGNRTTPIVVSVCAAAGVIIPKTSSRAITSAAGTADTIETLANVDLELDKLKEVVQKTGACLAWGGALGLAPADDKLIRVERLLNVDPESQLIASIMAKKLSAGSKHILIDIPYGEFAKVNLKKAKNLRRKFIRVGKYFKLNVKVVLTDGSEPIGNGVGPVLEMMDILKVLKQDSPPLDLQEKSLFLSGILLEMLGKSKKGLGYLNAKEILFSGKAYKKFNEILSAQGMKESSLKPGNYQENILSPASGKITGIDNSGVNGIARNLGCPKDVGSGIYLYKHKNQIIKKGEPLARLYSHSKDKLKEGISIFNRDCPWHIS